MRHHFLEPTGQAVLVVAMGFSFLENGGGGGARRRRRERPQVGLAGAFLLGALVVSRALRAVLDRLHFTIEVWRVAILAVVEHPLNVALAAAAVVAAAAWAAAVYKIVALDLTPKALGELQRAAVATAAAGGSIDWTYSGYVALGMFQLWLTVFTVVGVTEIAMAGAAARFYAKFARQVYVCGDRVPLFFSRSPSFTHSLHPSIRSTHRFLLLCVSFQAGDGRKSSPAAYGAGAVADGHLAGADQVPWRSRHGRRRLRGSALPCQGIYRYRQFAKCSHPQTKDTIRKPTRESINQ